MAAPAFFPSASKDDECWWVIYVWDSMEDQDKTDSLEALRNTDEWVIWKTKDDKWTYELKKEGFHQILSLDKDTRTSSWRHKIKGWWRRGDIKVTQCKKSVECWVKSPMKVSTGAQQAIKKALIATQQNHGKDNYTIDLDGPEKTDWLERNPV